MAMGPVQLLILGFDHPNFQGRILGELQRLRDNDLVRLVDGLAVYKDGEGNVTALRDTQLDEPELEELGAVVGALVGLGAAGPEGMEEGAVRGAELIEERGGVFDDETAWDVLAEIPPDSAAALLLIEHRWAAPLRDAVAEAGGMRLASEFISPLDLVAVGVATVEDARAMSMPGGTAI
jgi:uncharacterized membrane protein